MAHEDKRRQDGKRSPTRQARPEAEISPVSIEQDDKTNLPHSGELATASQEEEEERTEKTWFPKLQGKRTWVTDTKAAFRTMEAALTGQLTPAYSPKPRKTTRKDLDCATVDISMISAASFVYNCQDPGAALFSITLEEIDHEIQDRQATNQFGEATNAELVAHKLPVQY